MSIGLGIGVQRPKQLRSIYSVNGKVPGFAADFIKNKYPSYSSFASAITHSRSGNATMTDGYGPELVVNGGFDSDSDWTKGTGWTISDGVASSDGSQSSASALQAVDILTIGKTYVVTFTVVSRSAGSITARAGTNGVGTARTATGTYTEIITCAGTDDLRMTASNDFVGSIDNVSVREMPVLKWAPHNLLQYSEQFDNAAWSTLGINLTSVTTDLPTGASGTAYRVQDTDQGLLWQSLSLPVGSKHTVAVWAKRGGSVDNIFGLHINGNLTSPQFTATSEWQLFEFETTIVTAGSRSAGLIDFVGQVYDIIIWGMHLYRSDLGGMVDNPDRGDSYVPTTSSAVYLPRIGHHVYNGSAWVNEGLLAESEARTNLNTYSTPDSNWTLSTATITENDAVSPDGTENASAAIEATGTSSHFIQGNVTSITIGNVYTLSAYLKADTATAVELLFSTAGFPADAFAKFDLTNGTIGYVGADILQTTIQDVGNGWYRCSASATAEDASTSAGYFLFTNNDAASSTRVPSYAGSTDQQYFIYGVQFEEGSTPSSLIPTSGSSVTRASESFTIPSANLPWPDPNYIGPELVTNGTFDTDTSNWTAFLGTLSVVNSTLRVTADSAYGYAYQGFTTVIGNVYQVKATLVDAGTTGANFIQVGTNASPSSIINQNIGTTTGEYSFEFVATDTTTLVRVASGNGAGLYADWDNISVREINPLSVSIAMDGRVSYADNNVGTEVRFNRWYADSNNYIATDYATDGGNDRMKFEQRASGTIDNVQNVSAPFSPGIFVPFDVASRHGSTFVNGAVDGVALTANTTPTALPDLSATDLSLAYDYMGTLATFRVWDRDIGDTGLVEATSPSLEPSLSLTFEGVGTNSFVVNDWS